MKMATRSACPRKRSRCWIDIISGTGTIVLALAAGFLLLRFSHFGPPGRFFYRDLASGELQVPYGFDPKAPRQFTVSPSQSPPTKVNLILSGYSLPLPARPVRVWLTLRSDDRGHAPTEGRIRSVKFLPASRAGAGHSLVAAGFTKFRPPWGVMPPGVIEVSDGVDGYFSVPSSSRQISIFFARKRAPTQLESIEIYFHGFSLHWSAVHKGAPSFRFFDGPRSEMRMWAKMWPASRSVEPLYRLLDWYDISRPGSTKLIESLIKHKLTTLTDLSLVRSSLAVTGAEIRAEANVSKALWMSLLLTASSVPRFGPVVWVHLGGGRLLSFANGRFGQTVWSFNADGRAVAGGVVEYSISNWKKWRWPRRLQILRTVAIPFFSQTSLLELGVRPTNRVFQCE